MLAPLLLGCATLVLSLGIQVVAIIIMLRFLSRRIVAARTLGSSTGVVMLMGVLLVLFAGHLVQIAIWALLFFALGEFDTFATAYYHSTVNFATLGYGDIVMSERWRLLGALQAASGVLMFGLSTSALFATLSQLLRRWRGQLSQ